VSLSLSLNRFTLAKATKERLDGNFGLGKVSEGSPFPPLLAATFSELCSAVFDVPHDVIVQRVQVASLTPPHPDCFTLRDVKRLYTHRAPRSDAWPCACAQVQHAKLPFVRSLRTPSRGVAVCREVRPLPPLNPKP